MSARRALLAVMRKEVRQTARDRRMIALLVAAPVLQLILLGYAVDLEVDRIPAAVCDQDRTPASRRLVRGLLADGTLREAAHVARPGRALDRGIARAVIVLPRGLGRELAAGRTARVQVLVDGTDPLQSQVAEATASQYLYREGLELARRRLAAGGASGAQAHSWPTIAPVARIYYNPGMDSPVFMVPGVAALVLLVVTTVVTAMGIAREREMGTIEQLMITPIRPAVLLVGKILPFAVLGVVVTALVLTIGSHLFDVPVRGSPWLLLVATILYLTTTLGTGVFISTVSRTQQQAILGGLFFLMPAILLSGFATPIENMPGWLQPVTYLNPVRYFVTVLRANLLRGAGFADLWPQLGALAAFGAGILTLAALRFRRQLS